MELQEIEVQVKDPQVKTLTKTQFLQQLPGLHKEKLDKLQLTECNSQLPPELFTFRELTWLNISNNGVRIFFAHKTYFLQLSSIPPDIAKLTNLQYLDISFNTLTDLPREILSLKSLKSLDWSKGKLRRIPDIVFSMKSLKKLVISDNRLTELPDEISDLPLTELNIEKNLFK